MLCKITIAVLCTWVKVKAWPNQITTSIEVVQVPRLVLQIVSTTRAIYQPRSAKRTSAASHQRSNRARSVISHNLHQELPRSSPEYCSISYTAYQQCHAGNALSSTGPGTTQQARGVAGYSRSYKIDKMISGHHILYSRAWYLA